MTLRAASSLPVLLALVLAGPALSQTAVLAATNPVGMGCSLAAYPPQLVVSPLPVLGQTTAFNVFTSFGAIAGAVWISPGPSVVTPLNQAPFQYCNLYVDIATAIPLLAFDSPSGSWAGTLPIPNDPLLIGAVFTVQVAFYDPVLALPPGFTNGVEMTLGL